MMEPDGLSISQPTVTLEEMRRDAAEFEKIMLDRRKSRMSDNGDTECEQT